MRVLFTGEFTEEDLIEFARLLRKVERKNPSLVYTMVMHQPELAIEDAAKIVKKIYDKAGK